jgi:hypothetical protein
VSNFVYVCMRVLCQLRANLICTALNICLKQGLRSGRVLVHSTVGGDPLSADPAIRGLPSAPEGIPVDDSAKLALKAVENHRRLLTRALQKKLTKVCKDAETNDSRHLRAQQNELRELLRFYHRHEGEIFDICQSLREQDHLVDV